MLRPMLLFAVVIAIIANFQVFDTVYVLTQGGPYQSTSTMVWFIWKRLFQFQQTGQGYAAAVLLLGDHPVPHGDLVLAPRLAPPPRAGGVMAAPGAKSTRSVGPRRTPTTRRPPAANRVLRLGKGVAAYASCRSSR